jgi:hypothetical protein
MVSLHVPDSYSYSLLGIVLGVAIVPVSILATLFLVVKTVLGS